MQGISARHIVIALVLTVLAGLGIVLLLRVFGPDWSAYAPAVAEGYRATNEALDKLEHPVQALRRRASLADLAQARPPPRAARLGRGR